MTEHVHEWEIDWDDGTAVCRLPDCPARPLRDWEINERLNATERLSVKNARYFAKETRMLALRKYLTDYADTLEGKP